MKTIKTFVLASVLLFVGEQHSASANVITVSPVAVRSVGRATGYDYTSEAAIAGVIVPDRSPNKIWRAYEKFDLPDYDDKLEVTSAILTFSTRGEFPYFTNQRLGVFGASSDWQWGFNWSHQPMVTSAQLGGMPSSGGIFQVDVTDYLKSIYSGPMSASFMVRSLLEDYSWQDVVTLSGQTLSVTYGPAAGGEPAPDLPEPGAASLFALGFALLCAQYVRRVKNA